MRVEKTFIRDNISIHYILTDNVCMCCKHNPDNYNPMMGCDGKCKEAHQSVVECINFEKF